MQNKQVQNKSKHMEAEQQVLKEALNDQKSREMAITEQMQQRAEYQFRSQLREMEEKLSMMEANKIQSEDEWNERVNDERERADKYKAKYESAKGHLKQLEVQSNEYHRVMEELRVQNDELRNIIGQLQQQQRTLSDELTALRLAFKEQQGSKPGGAVGIGAGAG